jgi:hypothetical protein
MEVDINNQPIKDIGLVTPFVALGGSFLEMSTIH